MAASATPAAVLRHLASSTPTACLAAGLAAAGAAILSVVLARAPRASLILLMILALLLPLAWRSLRRRLDVFEPIVALNLAMAAMFVIRPIVDVLGQNWVHIGYDIEATFDQGLWLALLAVVGLEVGYFFGPAAAIAIRLPSPVQHIDVRRTLGMAICLGLLGAGLYGIFLGSAGGRGFLQLIQGGASAAESAAFASSTGYLYRAPMLAVPGSLILLALGRHRQNLRYILLSAVFLAPLVLVAFAVGGRSTLLIALGAPAIFLYASRGRRPRLATGAFVTICLLTVGVGFLREFRNADAPLRQEGLASIIPYARNPGSAIASTFSSSDNEMFDSFCNELSIVPAELSFRPGSTITDVLVRAVPRPAWPNKPLEVNDAIVAGLWPSHYASSKASPAFSIVGILYADSSYWGVFGGMLILGLAARVCWDYFCIHSSAIGAQLLLAVALPLFVLLVRGTLADTLSYVPFTAGPVIVFGRAIAARVSHSGSTTPSLSS